MMNNLKQKENRIQYKLVNYNLNNLFSITASKTCLDENRKCI